MSVCPVSSHSVELLVLASLPPALSLHSPYLKSPVLGKAPQGGATDTGQMAAAERIISRAHAKSQDEWDQMLPGGPNQRGQQERLWVSRCHQPFLMRLPACVARTQMWN